MTEITNGIYEDSSGNLVDINGKVLVPRAKRVRAEVYSRVVGGGISCHSRKVRKQWGRTSKN